MMEIDELPKRVADGAVPHRCWSLYESLPAGVRDPEAHDLDRLGASLDYLMVCSCKSGANQPLTIPRVKWWPSTSSSALTSRGLPASSSRALRCSTLRCGKVGIIVAESTGEAALAVKLKWAL